jgi:hypothetical protein
MGVSTSRANQNPGHFQPSRNAAHTTLNVTLEGSVNLDILTFIQIAVGVCLSYFRHVTLADISSAVEHLPDKSSATDPFPTGKIR